MFGWIQIFSGHKGDSFWRGIRDCLTEQDRRGTAVRPYPDENERGDYSSMLMIGQFTTTPIGPQALPSGPEI